LVFEKRVRGVWVKAIHTTFVYSSFLYYYSSSWFLGYKEALNTEVRAKEEEFTRGPEASIDGH
jgi:hypothetical protein